MDAETTDLLEAIGPRLRRLRRSRGLSLDDLANVTGLSISILSRFETGHRQPTLDLLIPLARAFEISLDALIAAPETGDPREHLEPQRLVAGGVAIPLTRHPSRVQAFKHVLGPREEHLATHPGQAWIHVLAGRLRLLVGAEHMFAPGESVEFDAAIPTGSARPTSCRSRSCTCSHRTASGPRLAQCRQEMPWRRRQSRPTVAAPADRRGRHSFT